jgi:predicted acyltransferase
MTGNAGYRLDKWIIGLAKLLLAGCQLITASLTWTRFFAVFGKNPLVIYILSELLVIVLNSIRLSSGQCLFQGINTGFFQAIAPGAFGSLLFALVYMLVCWGVGKWLETRKIYVRV